MDEIDYQAVSASLATQLAEQIYQTAQWKNLAEKAIQERSALRAELAAGSEPEDAE